MSVFDFVRCVEQFHDIDQEINVSMIKVFLFVAQRGACTQKDIEIGLSRANASISRIISWWCEQKAHGVEGVGFLQRDEYPRDRRYKIISLTPTGEAFYERLRKTAGEERICPDRGAMRDVGGVAA